MLPLLALTLSLVSSAKGPKPLDARSLEIIAQLSDCTAAGKHNLAALEPSLDAADRRTVKKLMQAACNAGALLVSGPCERCRALDALADRHASEPQAVVFLARRLVTMLSQANSEAGLLKRVRARLDVLRRKMPDNPQVIATVAYFTDDPSARAALYARCEQLNAGSAECRNGHAQVAEYITGNVCIHAAIQPELTLVAGSTARSAQTPNPRSWHDKTVFLPESPVATVEAMTEIRRSGPATWRARWEAGATLQLGDSPSRRVEDLRRDLHDGPLFLVQNDTLVAEVFVGGSDSSPLELFGDWSALAHLCTAWSK